MLSLVVRGAGSFCPAASGLHFISVGRETVVPNLFERRGVIDQDEGYHAMIEDAHLVHRLMPAGQSTIVLSIQALAACIMQVWLMLS